MLRDIILVNNLLTINLYVLRSGSVFCLQTKYCRNTRRSAQEPNESGSCVGLKLGL